MSNVIPFEYDGLPVHFSTAGWINATEIAKRFNKRPVEWLRLPETVSYMEALGRHLKVGKSHLYETTKGRQGGTWLHPKLGVRFAQWLDVDFAVWCDLHIDALLRGELNAQQEYDKACRALDDRRALASTQARGLAQWKYHREPLETRVDYWRHKLQLALPLDTTDPRQGGHHGR